MVPWRRCQVRADSKESDRQASFTIRALGDDIIAVDCPNGYSRSKPSFLVTDYSETHVEAQLVGPGRWVLRTKTLLVEGEEDPPHVRIFRTFENSEDPYCEFRNPSPEGATIVIDRGFALYGVGATNKDPDLDRRGRVYRVHHRETGQGNNHMPWVLSAQGFGVFFDSTFPMTLDLRDRFVVKGRNIRTYYFINGPAPAQALGRFVKLTGLPPMHPAWALGYEQSSRTWMGPGELDFVTTYFREKRIPCDGLALLSTYSGEGGAGRHGRGFHAAYLDGYQGWNAKGTYRKYNPRLLPSGATDVQRLRKRGFHPIVHGYWLSDYADPDATEKLWQDHKFLMQDGWEGWWLDGAESVWDDADLRRVGYVPRDHVPDMKGLESQNLRDEYDNIWALLRAKAFCEKQRRDFPDRRVYILNRTAFPGVQKYAAGVNQGDYWSSWQLLRIQMVWLLNMAMSGVMFPESDIGGFYPTEELTEELFIRWAFMATFAPLMRSHGCNWRCRLPWGFGPENEARFTRLIRLRYSMFPYNYTLLHQANQAGIPMMRPMVLEFPEDFEARTINDQYMWGRDIMVAPVCEKGARERRVYLAKGSWVHYWSLQRFEGPGWITVGAPLGEGPVFLRAGAITPLREPSDTIPIESDGGLILFALPTDHQGTFTLYDDDRRTYRYENGEFSTQAFSMSGTNESGGFFLNIGAVEGNHTGITREREYRIEVPKSLASIRRVAVAGTEIPFLGQEESGPKPYWQSLPDRFVVEVDRRAGPLRLDFR